MRDYSLDSVDESSDEESVGNSKQAFEIEFSDDFDPDSVPQNGHEYLQHVIYERRRCRKLMTSNIDPTKFNDNKTSCVKLTDTIKISPRTCFPTKEWQSRAIRDFKYFRSFIESHIYREPTCCKFNEETFISDIKSKPPLFSKITKYSQSGKITMLQLIMDHMNNLEEGQFLDDSICTWIFAILVLLQIPLSPSDCHVIRQFAIKCIDIRSSFQDDEEEKLPNSLNFFVSIISNYFGQLDLCD